MAVILSGTSVAGTLRDERETRFADVRQLTFGGENAEAYWSPDGEELVFQSTRPPFGCDQILRMPANDPAAATLVSTGTGRATCAFFTADGERIIYSSTHASSEQCPPVPDYSRGYVWPIYESYQIYTAKPDGSDLRALTDTDVYDAEATVCSKDGSIVFTSMRDGDLELYRMDADGANVKRLTEAPGYDGGAFFSRDCATIVWRASRPTGDVLADYQALLKQGLIRPGELEIWVANADGSDPRQVTYLGGANFAPYFFPDGNRIIFSSNHHDPAGREFDLWAVNVDGSGLEQITFTEGFDGFPMFSPDGTHLAFGSNRNQAKRGETNVFVARWVDGTRAKQPGAADRYVADVVFAGWGIDSADHGVTSYEGLDVEGKVVLVRRFSPEDGAPPPKLRVDAKGDAGIPVAVIKRGIAAALAEKGGTVELTSELLEQTAEVDNIVGRLSATERLAGSVVIGAHYDQLGHGGPNSLAPDSGETHSGADDNASGTAALLEAARVLAAQRAALRRDVIFVAFTGEEDGLLGSTELTRNPLPGEEASFVAERGDERVEGTMTFGTSSRTR